MHDVAGGIVAARPILVRRTGVGRIANFACGRAFVITPPELLNLYRKRLFAVPQLGTNFAYNWCDAIVAVREPLIRNRDFPDWTFQSASSCPVGGQLSKAGQHLTPERCEPSTGGVVTSFRVRSPLKAGDRKNQEHR